MIEHQMQLETEEPAGTGLATRGSSGEGFVTLDTAIVATNQRRTIDVIDAGFVAHAAGEEDGEQSPYSFGQRQKALITRRIGKIRTQQPRHHADVKCLEVLKRELWYKTSSVMISLSISPQSGPCFRSSFFPSVISSASHCGFMDWQKSSKSQKVSTSRSNMRASIRWLDRLTRSYQDSQMINSIQTHSSGYHNPSYGIDQGTEA
jgi:hypothetical protein